VVSLEWYPFHVVSKYPQCIVGFCHNACMWQTDGQNYDSQDHASIAASQIRKVIIIRPPSVVVGGLRFYHNFSSFCLCSFFSSATQWAHWMELNQNLPHVWKWVQFENACPKSPFDDCTTLMVTLTAYILGMKHDIHNWEVFWKLQEVSYIISKFHGLWSTNGSKLEQPINSLFY